MQIILTADENSISTTILQDEVATTFDKPLKRLVADNPDLNHFRKHLVIGRRPKKRKRVRPTNYPYIARFKRSNWTYLVKRTVEGKIRSAIFFHPDSNPTVEDVLRYNIQFAEARNSRTLNRHDIGRAKEAHERLIRILGSNYKEFEFQT